MKRMLKLLSAVLIILIVVCLTAAVVLWFFLPKEKIRVVIIKELSNRLNQDITMSDFSVGFYPGVEFLARDIRLVDSPTSQEILSAKKVRFDLNLRELLSLKCVVEKITFGSPTINFKRDVNGEWNVEKLIKGVLSGEKKADASKQVSWLEFSQIQIDNGTFRIHDEASGQHLSIQKIAANFDVRKESLHIDLASLSLPSLEADLSGTVSELFDPSPVLGINATLQIRKEGPFSDILSSDLPGGATIADISLDA
ncbi:MAG: AsmA family protein, partial [Deltaproteobacteria bacterium]|nr:AsmA family protein [Deltaproteobacteria bacterium]